MRNHELIKNTNMSTSISLRTIAATVLLCPVITFAQDRYAARAGEVSFHSSTPIENIDAVNRKATSVFDAATGDVQFAVLIKGFEFEKALMQEHFNENYMESNTYPKSNFTGKMTGVTAEQMTKPGKYDITVTGNLTMHGVTAPVTSKGTITVEGTTATAVSEFMVKPEDYKIAIPGVVRGKIAEQITIQVRIPYTKL